MKKPAIIEMKATFCVNINLVFWALHSIDTCPSYLQDKNLEGLDNGIHTDLILDLQRTFDTIDDNILFNNELCTIGLSSLSMSGSNHTHLTELLL